MASIYQGDSVNVEARATARSRDTRSAKRGGRSTYRQARADKV
jgi:hypothetical protein